MSLGELIISIQQHFKLHCIFHQALWMATLLRNSKNSLTSPLEQKTVKKQSKLQLLYPLARWQSDLPWNVKSELVVYWWLITHCLNIMTPVVEKTCRNWFFEGHDFNRMLVGYGWSTSSQFTQRQNEWNMVKYISIHQGQIDGPPNELSGVSHQHGKCQCDFLKGNITAPSTVTGQMAWYNMILILHYFSNKSKLLKQIEQLYKLHKQPSRSHINGLNIDFFELGTQVAPNSSFHAGSAKCGIFRTSMMLAKFSFLVVSTIKKAHEHPSRQQRTVWNDAVEIADKSLAALKVWVQQKASFWSKQKTQQQ